MTDLRCVSMRQPYASLVAAGVKTIIDRDKPTKHRGRIGIASGKKRPTTNECLMLGKFIGEHGGFWANAIVSCYSTNPAHSLPFGALVATANLVDCVPMVALADVIRGQSDAALSIFGDSLVLYENGQQRTVTDQLPYGDFTPGRWAWLLDDVKATTERCPACWGYGGPLGSHADLTGSQLNDGGAEAAYVVTSWCPSCDGKGACEPIPVKGHQGLWTWPS